MALVSVLERMRALTISQLNFMSTVSSPSAPSIAGPLVATGSSRPLLTFGRYLALLLATAQQRAEFSARMEAGLERAIREVLQNRDSVIYREHSPSS